MLVTQSLIVNTFFLPTISNRSPNNKQLNNRDNSVIVNADGFESVFFSEYTRIRQGLITLSGHTEAVEHNMGCSASFVWTSLPANDTKTTGRRLMGVKVGYALVRVDSD